MRFDRKHHAVYVSVHFIAAMNHQACGSASSKAGTAVVVNVSNQALLGSSIAEQVNVSDAVGLVVKVLIPQPIR